MVPDLIWRLEEDLPGYDFRVGIGAGTLDRPAQKYAINIDGPALPWLAPPSSLPRKLELLEECFTDSESWTTSEWHSSAALVPAVALESGTTPDRWASAPGDVANAGSEEAENQEAGGLQAGSLFRIFPIRGRRLGLAYDS